MRYTFGFFHWINMSNCALYFTPIGRRRTEILLKVTENLKLSYILQEEWAKTNHTSETYMYGKLQTEMLHSMETMQTYDL